jgi:hypothetical protein
MFRIAVYCVGLTEAEGSAAPPEILWDFQSRPWHSNPQCTWNGSELILVVENELDAEGLTVLSDFREACHACINFSGFIRCAIESVTVFAP